MAEKKKEKPEHIKHFETYKKHADVVDMFSDNIQINALEATAKALKKKDTPWFKDGQYDSKVIANGDEKVLDTVTDTILNEMINSISPNFKKMYKMDLPKLGDDPASKDFYQTFLGINKREVKRFVQANKKDFKPAKVQEHLTDNYINKWSQRLKVQTYDHIDPEKHLEDYIKEYKLQDTFDKDMLPALKKSQEAPLVLQHILDSARQEGKVEGNYLKSAANSIYKQTDGKVNIIQYLKD